MPIAILTDSTCDLTLEQLDSLKVFMLPLTVSINGKDYVDVIDIDAHKFYELSEQSEELPKSSQPSPGTIKKKLQEIQDAGFDECIAIFISSGLSGTAHTAEQVIKNFTGMKTYFVDSKTGSAAHGFLVEQAALMRDRGLDAKTIYEHILEAKQYSKIFFCPATLENLVKGGRASKFKAFAASLLDIKIIVSVDEAGNAILAHKMRGIEKAKRTLIQSFKDFVEKHAGNEVPWVRFVNTGDEKSMLAIKEGIEKLNIPYIDKGVSYPGPVITTHVGTDAFGFAICKPPLGSEG
ncbi:MAG: DegV family protein [Coriobacteriia bacterium]|nr:DegV family protein [Coriobacteriia bacterium]